MKSRISVFSCLNFNQRLAAGLFFLIIAIAVKLFTTAVATNNMRGMYFSLVHVVIVAAGSYLVLREKGNP